MDRSNLTFYLIFIVLAILATLNHFNIFSLSSFGGYWTLFIIVPSLFALTDKKTRKGGLIGFIIGFIFLLISIF